MKHAYYKHIISIYVNINWHTTLQLYIYVDTIIIKLKVLIPCGL